MMSGSQKGIPLKVPTIPIKVVTPNATQVDIMNLKFFIHNVGNLFICVCGSLMQTSLG